LWDVKKVGRTPMAEPAAKDLEELWATLAGADAGKAHDAIRSLIAAPRQAVALFRKHVPSAAAVDPRHLEKLIADLDHDDFAVRRAAEEELAKMGEQARPALVKALDAKPSLDVTRRLETLLAAREQSRLSSEEVRQMRAVEVLEALGTDEARGLFEEWAWGAAGSLLTEEAKASLARLAQGRR
jgi:hypothetical protein